MAAEEPSYVDRMIACKPKDEAVVSDMYDAFLQLLRGRELAAGALRFPKHLIKISADQVIIGRAFYVTPNELRGFEILIPNDCVREKDGMLVTSVPVVAVRVGGSQGITSVVVRKKLPNAVGSASP